MRHSRAAVSLPAPVDVVVVIEVPRGGFVKRGSSGSIDFVSPLPCPFNYGAVPTLLGLDNDLLDALVLGPRLPYGTRAGFKAWGAVTFIDRGVADDKLICSAQRPSVAQVHMVLGFFHVYARCKGLLNLWRRRPGRNACDGWRDVSSAMARARPLADTAVRTPMPF